MAQGLRRITKAMEAILADPKASRLEKIEAGRIAASAQGVLIPSALDAGVPTKLAAQLQLARRTIAEKLFEQRAKKVLKNRRQYVRRRITELTESGANPDLLAEFTRELEGVAIAQNATKNAPEAPVDPEAIQRAVANAKAYLEQYNGGNEDGQQPIDNRVSE